MAAGGDLCIDRAKSNGLGRTPSGAVLPWEKQDSHGKWWENDLFIWGFNIDIDLTLISHGWYMMKAF